MNRTAFAAGQNAQTLARDAGQRQSVAAPVVAHSPGAGPMRKRWWKESVVYQIYPRSFCDSNGDGIGDLRGIISKVDYLKELGVDVVWLSPVFQSPNDDNGYDISDYQAIMPEFGTMADWEEMLAALHARGMKLIMDLVVNHTSDEHPWFIESRKSKDNPYRDYYIWRPGKDAPGKDGAEPNNWSAFFGGSAWKLDEATGEYFLHLFSPKQPDLNWENPRLRQEIYQMMHWWLAKGIDGFRMDVINMISKVPGLPDAPHTGDSRYQSGTQFFVNGPRLRDYLAEMQREVLSKYDLFTVGEMPLATTEHAISITDEEHGHLSMLFQFEHMDLDTDAASGSKWHFKLWELLQLKSVMSRWQQSLDARGWNSLYLSNHDQPRAVSRFGNDKEYRIESAKLLATFLHMLKGTPYVYQGEEIGMTNVHFESIDDYRDIETLNAYHEFVDEKEMNPQAAMAMIYAKSRDNGRTPMQWTGGPQAGFTTGKPWIRLNPNYPQVNVQQALADPRSIFHYYQRLIALRKSEPVMVNGKYELILPDHPDIYAFTRTTADDQLLVILNFGVRAPVFTRPAESKAAAGDLVISNYDVPKSWNLSDIQLRPYEARVYRMKPSA